MERHQSGLSGWYCLQVSHACLAAAMAFLIPCCKCNAKLLLNYYVCFQIWIKLACLASLAGWDLQQDSSEGSTAAFSGQALSCLIKHSVNNKADA